MPSSPCNVCVVGMLEKNAATDIEMLKSVVANSQTTLPDATTVRALLGIPVTDEPGEFTGMFFLHSDMLIMI